MKPVHVSPQARLDVLNIAEHIAQNSPGRAVSFAEELLVRANAIGSAPMRYPLRAELGPKLRLAPYGNYVIVYSVRARDVEIVRIVHGARDLKALLSI